MTVFDEVQRCPDLLSYRQSIVDATIVAFPFLITAMIIRYEVDYCVSRYTVVCG